MVGIPSLPAYVTKILSVTYYAYFGLYCPEWQFNGTVFRDAQLNRFFLSLWFSQRVHRQPKALDEPTSGLSAIRRQCGICSQNGNINSGWAVVRPESMPCGEITSYKPTSQDESRYRGRMASGSPTIRKLIPHGAPKAPPACFA